MPSGILWTIQLQKNVFDLRFGKLEQVVSFFGVKTLRLVGSNSYPSQWKIYSVHKFLVLK